jgi:1-acyl-sn-glycerol-3-phosphate acyltransferase
VNFVEGTRFSEEKRLEQQAPYRHLLRPKSGGLALILSAIGPQLSAILDVTIVYPGAGVSLWKFLSGQVPWIVVEVDRLRPPIELSREADADASEYREEVLAWIQERWSRKDARIERVHASVGRLPFDSI